VTTRLTKRVEREVVTADGSLVVALVPVDPAAGSEAHIEVRVKRGRRRFLCPLPSRARMQTTDGELVNWIRTRRREAAS